MTVSLQLIDGGQVVTRSLRLAVAELDARFVSEDQRDLPPSNFAWPEGDEVWLWRDDAEGRAIGFAAFPGGLRGPVSWPASTQWPTLMRVWIEPAYRRQGLLTKAWDAWTERYGAFDVESPNRAMRAFLDRRELIPLASDGGGE